MPDHTAHAARGRLGFHLWVASALAAVAYPLSLGPAFWTLSKLSWEMRRPEVAHVVSRAYRPLAPAVIDGPEPVRRVMKWWIGVGMPARTTFHDDWPQGVGWSNPGYTYTLWHY